MCRGSLPFAVFESGCALVDPFGVSHRRPLGFSLDCGVPRPERDVTRGREGTRLAKHANISRIRWAARRGLPRTHHDLLHMAPRDRDRFLSTQLLSVDAAFWAARGVVAEFRRAEMPVMLSGIVGES